MVEQRRPGDKAVRQAARRRRPRHTAACRQQRARRAARLARRQQRRQARRYQPWRRLTRDQQAVAARLTAGRVEAVTVSGWGIVGQWLTFLDELGYLGLLEIEGAGYQRVLIPLARRLLTYQVKVLLGIGSINLVPTRLFRDPTLLKLIGYTTAQIAAGFCRRGDLAAGPMHKNTLADAIERLSAEELETLLNATVQRLVARGVFQHSAGHFALDASDLETTRRFAYPLYDPAVGYVVGFMTVRKERRQRGGAYWTAYRRRGARLRKVYLGRSGTLTQARLQAIADALREEARRPR